MNTYTVEFWIKDAEGERNYHAFTGIASMQAALEMIDVTDKHTNIMDVNISKEII